MTILIFGVCHTSNDIEWCILLLSLRLSLEFFVFVILHLLSYSRIRGQVIMRWHRVASHCVTL
jgi:hypothetical protein